MENNYYIRNLETGKLEMHFDKDRFLALTNEQKAEIRSAFLWGRNSNCWISRSKTPNLWHAEQIAKKVGLADAGTTGERLTFAEQQERKAERAEHRAERYEEHAANAADRGERLQKPINDMHGDISFFTQPNINSSGGRSFTNRRNKMFEAFESGFKEYRKSEYWERRAKAAHNTADQKEMNDKGFVQRRIEECEADIRGLKRAIESYEAETMPKAQSGTLTTFAGDVITVEQAQQQLDVWADRMEIALDKLGYYMEALDALGGVQFSKDNIKPGMIVAIPRYGHAKVLSTGPKNFTVDSGFGFTIKHAYAEISAIISDKAEVAKAHPFKVGETFTLRDNVTHTISKATDKTVTITTSDGKTYRAKPVYTPIPAQKKSMWRLWVGNESWAGQPYYRD